MKETWIIVIFNNDGGCDTYKAFGTREEMHELVLKRIIKDREEFGNWGVGTTSVDDFTVYCNNGFIGHNWFYDYSIKYVAYPYSDIPEFEEA